MIHKSWKRIEILNIIDKLGIDVKTYSYLNKDDCFIKFSLYIKSNNIKELEYLFRTKPVIHMPIHKRSILTKKARKVLNYCKTLDLNESEYVSIIKVKEDIDLIKEYQWIPCIRKAIQSWNEINEEFIPNIQEKLEYELTLDEEKALKRKLKGLTVKKGIFILDLS